VENVIQIPSQLGQVLRTRRAKLAYNQTKAGANVGVAQKTVSSLERHPEKSTVETLMRMLSALELEMVIRPRGNPAKKSAW